VRAKPGNIQAKQGSISGSHSGIPEDLSRLVIDAVSLGSSKRIF
jgi:hypothetical protein